jgi:uncharacterized membrane protein HdeD (DUF308 family)
MFKNLKTNVGTVDRVLRVVVGLALIAAFFFLPAQSGWHWLYLIGIVPLVSGLLAYCPVYSALGYSTCRADSSTTKQS